MDQRVSVLTLGVTDLGGARAFYEALGWKTNAAPDDDVVFFQAESTCSRVCPGCGAPSSGALPASR